MLWSDLGVRFLLWLTFNGVCFLCLHLYGWDSPGYWERREKTGEKKNSHIMFAHVRVLFNSEAGKKETRFKYLFHHSKNLPFRLFKDPYGLLGCPGHSGKIWERRGCESTKSAKNTELIKFWKVWEQLQRHLIWQDEWVTWCRTRFSSVQTKCCTLKGRKKMDVLLCLTGLSITCSGLGKAAECHSRRLSDHLNAEHSSNLLVRQDVRLQKEQDRE